MTSLFQGEAPTTAIMTRRRKRKKSQIGLILGFFATVTRTDEHMPSSFRAARIRKMGESEETSELEESQKLTEELWYKSKLDENDRRKTS